MGISHCVSEPDAREEERDASEGWSHRRRALAEVDATVITNELTQNETQSRLQ